MESIYMAGAYQVLFCIVIFRGLRFSTNISKSESETTLQENSTVGHKTWPHTALPLESLAH